MEAMILTECEETRLQKLAGGQASEAGRASARRGGKASSCIKWDASNAFTTTFASTA